MSTPEHTPATHSPETALPTVIVDASLGKYVEAFDIDTPAIAEYLRGRGLEDEQISGLTMHFTSEIEGDLVAKGNVTMGEYSNYKYTARLLPPVAEPLEEWLEHPDDRDELHEMMGGLVPTNITHELEHYLQHLRDGDLGAVIANHAAEFKSSRIKRILATYAGTTALVGAEIGASVYIDAAEPYALPAMGVTALAGISLIVRDIKNIRLDHYYQNPYEAEAYAAAEKYDHRAWLTLTYKDLSQ